MRLIHRKTGKEVKTGETVTDFRGDKAKIVSFSKPHKPASSGKVLVETSAGHQGEYYVSVFDMEWIEREDR